MAVKIGFVQSVVNALIDGRQRTAQRYVDRYLRDHPDTPRADKR